MMTETDFLGKLSWLETEQQTIAHCAGISEEGVLLRWGAEEKGMFEIVCRSSNAKAILELDRLLTEGHEKARVALS